MIFNYYNAMDKSYGRIVPSDIPPAPDVPIEVSSLGPAEIGTSTNPMGHQVQGFAAKIREGASKIELSFMGAGKSNSQQPSPEAFGRRDREDIRALAEINKIKTSVHAALHGESLAGLGREGFSGEARRHALKEIERAIQFSAEATKGGAIVFHTGEWMRPMTEITDKSGAKFMGYEDEKEKAPKIVVDRRTGEITAVRKDHLVYEPEFYTAATYEPVIGRKLVGTKDPETGLTIEKDDWVDINGHVIKREWILEKEKTDALFERVPVFQPNSTNFKVKVLKFDDFEKEADRLRKLGYDVTGEELFFKSQTANQVLQYKGNSLFHGQHYQTLKERHDATQKALSFYSKLDAAMPEDEKWKMMTQQNMGQFIPPKNMSIKAALEEDLKQLTDQMRHVHESSASADAMAKQAQERMDNFVSIEKYGLDKTGWTIAQAGLKAFDYSKAHAKDLDEAIYVAPENYRPEQYGSHPDEIRNIIKNSRKQMQQALQKKGYSEEEAKKLASTHIKATVDVGHFNMWRQFFEPKKNEKGEVVESPEAREKRFNKWLLDETQKLAKEGVLGHIHLTDNFGYDDEHLSPGQGNVPMKEFVKNMEAAGLKDFIAEAGSYNGTTVMQDTWALMGSPVYSAGGPPSFRKFHHQEYGFHNPATYIVGAYAPSNEWHLWTEVPFE